MLFAPLRGVSLVLVANRVSTRPVGVADCGLTAADPGPDGSLRPAAGVRVVRLDDQRCYLQLPEGTELEPGEAVCFGVSHPLLHRARCLGGLGGKELEWAGIWDLAVEDEEAGEAGVVVVDRVGAVARAGGCFRD